MTLTIIGVDCAVQEKNIGLAYASFENGETRIERVLTGGKGAPIAATTADWLAGARIALLALDAPLGWPAGLGAALQNHQAGQLLVGEPNQLFRRATDRFIRQAAGKQPLDVGADRIARTAHAALNLLAEIEALHGEAVPLAWEPEIKPGVSAIEIYPAATLIAHGISAPGYKRRGNRAARRTLLGALQNVVKLPADLSLLEENDDALDAVLCVLAGADFLNRRAYAPRDMPLARQEGWIWVKRLSQGE
jgi:predicted RNase H-like nuclease